MELAPMENGSTDDEIDRCRYCTLRQRTPSLREMNLRKRVVQIAWTELANEFKFYKRILSQCPYICGLLHWVSGVYDELMEIDGCCNEQICILFICINKRFIRMRYLINQMRCETSCPDEGCNVIEHKYENMLKLVNRFMRLLFVMEVYIYKQVNTRLNVKLF